MYQLLCAENAEALARLIQECLSAGRRYTQVTVANGQLSGVLTGQRLSRVQVIGIGCLEIRDSYGLRTVEPGACIQRVYNHGWQIRIDHKAPCGEPLTWVFACEATP